MRLILYMSAVLLGLLLNACEHRHKSSRSETDLDCRRSGYECAVGFRCLEANSGTYECVPTETAGEVAGETAG